MTYPTKKDIWLVLIAALGGLMLLIQAINLIIVERFYHPETWILFAISTFYFGILLLLTYPVNIGK